MNYKKHYDLLINKAVNNSYTGYTGYVEQHHIIPRCVGGNNNKDNIVALLPEEHYVAHQLLVKIYPDNKKLLYAAIMMIPNSKQQCRDNKLYGWLRRRYSEQRKKDTIGKNNPSYNKKWYYHPITMQTIKVLPEDVLPEYLPGRKPNVKDRYCRTCGVYVDTVSRRNSKEKLCTVCKDKQQTYKHNYELIYQVYKEHKDTGQGYGVLAEKYTINKWTIYDYITRYKDKLKNDYGV